MQKRSVSIISLLILWCLGYSFIAMAAAYNPIVEQAQTRLTELGYDPGPIDGLWGKKTETALKSFQQAQELPVTGKLDEETLQKLGLAMSEEPPPIVEQPDQQTPLKAAQQPQKEEQAVTTEQLDALFQKALEYYNSGNYVQAIEYCTQVIEWDSSHAQAYWYRGIAYGEQEEYDVAISDFRKVTELQPDFAGGYGMWAGVLLLQGKFEEARPLCRKASTLAPENIIWTMMLGHTFLLTGDRGTARRYYQNAIALITSQEELRSAFALFEVFIENGWQAEACQQEAGLMEQEFSAKEQRQVQELFQQALEYHQAENYEKAEEYYTKVIERDPTMSDAYWNRGLIYGKHQIYDLAASDFRKVTELLPDFADAYGNLGWYLFVQDKFEEAKAPYRKAIELAPGNITWMMNLGHNYLFTHDRTSARTYYQKVLPLLESEEDFTQATLLLTAFIEADVEAAAFRQELEWMKQEFDKMQHYPAKVLYQQAVQYDETGEDDKALEQYTQVIKLDPNYANAYWKRGVIFSQRKQAGAAMSDFRKATQLKPDFTEAYGMLGWLLLLQGRFEEARASYQKAHDLQPEEFRWGFALGHTHLLAGDLPIARTCYQNAITVVGTEQEFQAALAVFDEFIAKGWQVEICRQELEWLKQEFEKRFPGQR